MSARFVTVTFDLAKANAVFLALRAAIVPLVKSGTITNEECVGYVGFTLGQLLVDVGVQLDPDKPYEPMMFGYTTASAAARKGKAAQ